MTTTTAKLESLKKTINLLSRIASDIQSDDHESLDALHRAISDAKVDLFELAMSLPDLDLIAA